MAPTTSIVEPFHKPMLFVTLWLSHVFAAYSVNMGSTSNTTSADYEIFKTDNSFHSGNLSALAKTFAGFAAQIPQTAYKKLSSKTTQPGRVISFRDWGEVLSADPGFTATSSLPKAVESSAGEIKPGSLVRATPMALFGAVQTFNPASAYRIEYVTEDSNGRLITATAGVCLSGSQWLGGPRPVIGFAPSTQVVAPHCNPSHTCTTPLKIFPKTPIDAIIAYELPVINYLLARGSDVVLIDYPRNNHLGIQYYCDSISAAHALFDALRAARQLGISADAPVRVWGFSQGWGAASWVAQLPNYAPDVNPKAAVIGAPPSSFAELLEKIDGGMVMGVIAYCVAGLIASREELAAEIIPTTLSSQGLQDIFNIAMTCAGGTVLGNAYHSSASWTKSGKQLAQVLPELAEVSKEFDRQRIGGIRPAFKTLLWDSVNDDVIPFGQVRKVRDEWIHRGADIVWHSNPLRSFPGRSGMDHYLPYFQSFTAYADWLFDELWFS